MQKRDSERQIIVIFALDQRPALGGNLIHSTPRGCFSDETAVPNPRQGMGKEVNVCFLQLCGAVGKPFRKNKATDLLGRLVRIESPFSKEKGKVIEKHHTLFTLFEIFKGAQVRGNGHD